VDGSAQTQLHSALFQSSGSIGLGLIRKGIQHGIAPIDQYNLCLPGRQILESSVLLQYLRRVTESPCHFSPGRASSHNDKVERAFLDERGIAVRGFQDGKDSGSQYLGIAKRIERIAGLLRARRSEEVRPRTGCQNQKIPVVLRAFAGDYGSGMEI